MPDDPIPPNPPHPWKIEDEKPKHPAPKKPHGEDDQPPKPKP